MAVRPQWRVVIRTHVEPAWLDHETPLDHLTRPVETHCVVSTELAADAMQNAVHRIALSYHGALTMGGERGQS